jgi:hypothetical protein
MAGSAGTAKACSGLCRYGRASGSEIMGISQLISLRRRRISASRCGSLTIMPISSGLGGLAWPLSVFRSGQSSSHRFADVGAASVMAAVGPAKAHAPRRRPGGTSRLRLNRKNPLGEDCTLPQLNGKIRRKNLAATRSGAVGGIACNVDFRDCSSRPARW